MIIIAARALFKGKIPVFKSVDELQNYRDNILKHGGLYIPPYDYQLPKLPKYLNKIVRYKSYEINPYNYTCTCDMGKKNKILFPGKDLRRVCRHQYSLFKFNEKFNKYFNELSILLMKNYLYHGEQMLLKEKIPGKIEEFYVGARYYMDWVNVYLPQSDKNWWNYGYSLEEKRWSRTSEPKFGKEIEEKIESDIKTLLKKYLTRRKD